MTKEFTAATLLRYGLAMAVTTLFLLPIFWFALISLRSVSDIFNRGDLIVFDFAPTLNNYRAVLLGTFPADAGSKTATNALIDFRSSIASIYDARPALLSSALIALGSSVLTTTIAVLAAYALSRFRPVYDKMLVLCLVLARFVPAIAIVIPLVFIFHYLGLRDTHLGVMLAHTVVNLPIAVLLLKSFFDEIPVETDAAAMIDGATRWQSFRYVVLPVAKGGVATTLIVCFIFSWTEFLLSLFLTSSIRTLPVQIALYSTQSDWGYIAALGTSALVPGFVFILCVQRHLAAGLTLGAVKG